MSAQKHAWKTSQWNGLPRYACTECPFDTLSEGEIAEHARGHQAAPAPAASVVTKEDRFGNPVEE